MHLSFFLWLIFFSFSVCVVNSQVLKVELPNNLFAFSFQEDKEGKIWIGLSDGNTSGCLGVYHEDIFSLKSNNDGIPTGSYHTSIKLPDGSLIFSGNILNEKGRSLIIWISSMGIDTIQIPFLLKNPHINCIELVNRSEMWIGTSSGLITNNRGEWNWFTSQQGLPSNFISCIYQDFRGVVWVGTDNGIAFFMDGNLFLPEKGSKIISSATTFFGDNRGYIWCGARYASEGVSVYNGQVWETFSGRHGLVDNSATIFHQDSQGNLWVGSCYHRSRGGVSVFDGRNWVGYNSPEYIAKPCVDAIVTDSKGNIWLGGSLTARKSKGITVFDGNEWFITGGDNNLPAERVIAFFIDSRGNLWVSSFEGLFIVSPDFSDFKKL
jgi:ligand-binding sensor domain-containing protein